MTMTCLCHSLSFCVQHVFEMFPSSSEFLLAKIPEWSQKHCKNRNNKTLYEVMNPDDDQMRPFEKYSTTSWLMRVKVIFCIIPNFKVCFLTGCSRHVSKHAFSWKSSRKQLSIHKVDFGGKFRRNEIHQ